MLSLTFMAPHSSRKSLLSCATIAQQPKAQLHSKKLFFLPIPSDKCFDVHDEGSDVNQSIDGGQRSIEDWYRPHFSRVETIRSDSSHNHGKCISADRALHYKTQTMIQF